MLQKGKKNKKQGMKTAALGNLSHTHLAYDVLIFLTLKNQEMSKTFPPQEKKIQLPSRFSINSASLLTEHILSWKGN